MAANSSTPCSFTEKSFEDWNKNRTRWEHINESRDGRILFENFLLMATR